MDTSIRRFLPTLLLISLIGACGAPSERDQLDEARISHANGDDETAMIQLKNLLRAYPDNKEGRLLRGEVALFLEDGATAEKDLLRAEELGAERGDIVAQLGKSMMLQGAFDRVIAEIHTGSAPDEQKRIDILLLRGDAYIALGKPDNAARAFRDVSRLAPDSPDAMVGLGRVALAKDEIGNALTELARAVSAGPQLPQVWLANGQVQLAAGNAVEAKESFERAIQLKPVTKLNRDDFSVLNGLFHAHLALDEMDEALAVAETALEVGQGHPFAHYLRGQHAARTDDIETATTHLLKTLAAFPNHLGALSLMGSLSLQQDKLKEAETYLRQAVVLDNDNPRIRMQLAQTMLQLHQGDDALEVLAPVMRQLGDVPELLALAGRATAVSKDRSEWVSYFEQAAAADPANLKWQFELAQAYIAGGKADKSIDILKGIPDSADTTDQRDLMMVEALRRTGQLDAAIDVAKHLATRNPDDTEIRVLLGQLHMSANNLETAREFLEGVLDEDTNNIPALLTLGQVEVRAEQLDPAEALFREAYTKQPDYPPTVTLLVALAQSRGKNDEAIEWLEAARLTNPDSVMPRVGLVAMYLMQDDVSRAYELAQEAVALEPKDPRALVSLGITQTRREQYQDAIRTLEDAAIVAPQSGMIQFELSKAHHAVDEISDARRALNKAVTLSPWRVNYAVAAAKLELSLDNAAQASQIAQDLIRNHSANPVGYTLMGKALTLADRHAEAATVLARAVEVGQKEEFVFQHYDALARAGDTDPQSVLINWLDEHPQDFRVRGVLAQVYHRNGETADAIEQYEGVLKEDPDNLLVLNNLAWLLIESDAPRALELAKKTHKIKPHVGTFTDTLGWMLIQIGEMDDGLRLIREAVQQSPSEGEIRYHLAAALAQTGEVDEAKLLLNQLINSGKPFKSDSEARELLQNL